VALPTISLYVCVTLLTNHQQICVLTCVQPTWSLTEFFPYSADHSPTLWRDRGQEASEFLYTNTPLFGEIWATKNIAQKTRKCSLRHATNVVFSKKFMEKIFFMEKILSDFKWAGHRLAHIFADGWTHCNNFWRRSEWEWKKTRSAQLFETALRAVSIN